MKIVAKSFIT